MIRRNKTPSEGAPPLVADFVRKWVVFPRFPFSSVISSGSSTVGTPNKGQPVFSVNGSNKGISGIPLFAIFKESHQIREFSRLNPEDMLVLSITYLTKFLVNLDRFMVK